MNRRVFVSDIPGHRVVVAMSVLIAGIALTDWLLTPEISLGLLYFFPLALGAPFLARRETVAFALICSILQEEFRPSAWGPDLAPRFLVSTVAYVGVGLLIVEMERRGQLALTHVSLLSQEIQRREAAEQQLRSLVEGSPAPIFTIDGEGRVSLANEAARQLLNFNGQSMAGQPIDQYLPVLATLRQTSQVRNVRTMIECTGHRCGGETFLAHVWVSSFGPPAATGLTAIVFDSSEQLRDREEAGLQTLATGARVIMGAYWHETRNMCTAMRLTANSLKQLPGVAESDEMAALHSLIAGLEKLASGELRPESAEEVEWASLRAVFDQLRIVIEPWFQELGVEIAWKVADDVPVIRAEEHGILQVFLNIARNAHRALENSGEKEFCITASVEGGQTLVRFHNSGPPVADPAALFAPFQAAAAGRGIGLYVSRAIARSFGGDLRYEPAESGCCFTVAVKNGDPWYRY